VELLPPVRAVSALFVHAIFFALLIATVLFCGEPLSVYALQSMYYSFCALTLSLGLGVLCAAVSPFFKDVVNTVAIVLQVGFWVTPVAWSPALFGEGIVRLLKLNPVFYVVQGYRDSFLGGVWFWQRPAWGLYFWLVCAVVWAAAVVLFKRLRPQFADAL
jgi:teichoic acid transport system permease protein